MRRLLAVAAALLLLLPQQGLSAPHPEEVSERSELLVLFAPDADASARRAIHSVADARVDGHIAAVNLDRVFAPRGAAAVYRSMPGVAAVERARTLHLMGRKDPLRTRQWGLVRIGGTKTWPGQKKGAAVKVAVVDTGVDAGHPDLEGRVEDGYDYLARDDDPFDDHGHGTHIAGVIAANVGNGRGVAGLALKSTIIPMKACERGGACPVFETYLGIVDAIQRGAGVINLSLGGPTPCSFIDQTIYDYAYEQGVVVVAAAGNAATDDNPSISPANCNHTLGVGATDPGNRRAKFSGHGDWVDIAAPGVDIWSTLPPLLTIATPTIGYGPMNGTSMATPFVVAVAAIVRSKHPEWGPDEIVTRLTKTATDLGKKGHDPHFGAGLVNARRAAR